MRIAALADIHGNRFALEAVLDDLVGRRVDQTVNLGDHLYGPIAPRATYELLTAHPMVHIRGNQDRYLVEASETEIESNPTLRWVLDDLGDEPLHWVRSLEFDHQLEESVYLCHGSPSSDLEYLLEAVGHGTSQVRADADILNLLGDQQSELVLCAHTHVARTVQLSTGRLVVNPGSVGLPAYADTTPSPHAMQSFSPHARYALLEQGRHGWTVQHVQVPYDHEAAAEAARRYGRADWAEEVRSGRAAPEY